MRDQLRSACMDFSEFIESLPLNKVIACSVVCFLASFILGEINWQLSMLALALAMSSANIAVLIVAGHLMSNYDD